MQRMRHFLARCCCLAIVSSACQSAAPIAPAPPAAGPTSTSNEAAAPTSAPALGIDLRVPPTRAPRASPSPVATAVGVSVTVTLADNGRTISLQTGQRASVSLGDDFDWTVQVEDPSILSRITGVAVVAGAQVFYQANRAGQTTLIASGDPACRKAQPACAQASRTLRVTIVVQ
jgi:hypothetical protein